MAIAEACGVRSPITGGSRIGAPFGQQGDAASRVKVEEACIKLTQITVRPHQHQRADGEMIRWEAETRADYCVWVESINDSTVPGFLPLVATEAALSSSGTFGTTGSRSSLW